MIQEFKKKPVVIEAWLYDGTDRSEAEAREFTGTHMRRSQGVLGEFYPCDSEVFDKTYEVVP